MYNDSVETLLLRHYGRTAPAPELLEQRLIASVRREAVQTGRQQRVAEQIRDYRMSRRRAIKLVAIGSAGLGLLSVGLESLHSLEQTIAGQNTTRPAFS